LATSTQDAVNQTAALIESFRAGVQDVAEGLQQFVREFAELDSSPGEPFL